MWVRNWLGKSEYINHKANFADWSFIYFWIQLNKSWKGKVWFCLIRIQWLYYSYSQRCFKLRIFTWKLHLRRLNWCCIFRFTIASFGSQACVSSIKSKRKTMQLFSLHWIGLKSKSWNGKIGFLWYHNHRMS